MEIIAFLDNKTLNLINFVASSYCFDDEEFRFMEKLRI